MKMRSASFVMFRPAPTGVLLLWTILAWAHPLMGQNGSENGEWRFYGGDAGSTKYSESEQIDRTNVAQLEIAWRWKTDNFGPLPEINPRVTPLMVDGVLYTTAGFWRDVAAVDAGTGETLWMYRVGDEERARTSFFPFFYLSS